MAEMFTQWLMLALAGLVGAGPSMAETSISRSPVILRAEAYAGQPLGVGKLSYRLGQADTLARESAAVWVSEAKGRVLYPVHAQGLLARAFRVVLGNSAADPLGQNTVWFLFRGEEPLEITLHASDAAVRIVPVHTDRARAHRSLLDQWWQNFRDRAESQMSWGDYPPQLETYLVAMLGQRLGYAPPRPRGFWPLDGEPMQSTMDLLLNTESMRAQAISELIHTEPSEAAAIALPEPVQWRSGAAAGDDTVEVEEMAAHVPQHFFYLRFGSWDNQLWLKELLAEYGGDLSRMIQLRGHQVDDQTKMLQQLVMQSSQIDDWLGGNLIADVAFIGTDLYMRDGPSAGILLQAKNGLLRGQLESRRRDFARQNRDAGVTLQQLEIDGHPVSLLSSPDNVTRSFYVANGSFHLVCTSRELARQFLAVGRSQPSLADHPEFQAARRLAPVSREDTVFAYLSSEFFQNLLSPQYQVELARRNRALASMQIRRLAALAAANEGFATDEQTLLRHGFLSRACLQPPVAEQQGADWIDTLRGKRGYFLPIADAEISGISEQESQWLTKRQSNLARFGRPDPMLIAVQRYQLERNVERVVFDARIAPFAREKYGFLGMLLGPPLEFEVQHSPMDLIRFQASMAALPGWTTGPGQIFAALQSDLPPKTDFRPASFLDAVLMLKTAPGYVGAWPKPGLLDFLPALGARPDPDGFTYSPLLGIWRLQSGEFSLLSFDRQRLDQLRSTLAVLPTERPAQLRLSVGDIAQSNLRSWIEVIYFNRAWQTSLANVRMLHSLCQQLGVEPADALSTAEELLGVKLVCSLGGTYEISGAHSTSAWTSDAWPPIEDPHLPQGFQPPPLAWFRGLSLELTQTPTQLALHGWLDMKREGGGWKLPSFDLFNGFAPLDSQRAENKSQDQLPPPPPIDHSDRKPE